MPLPLLATFLITFALNWVLSRLSAQDGPRLENREAGSGEYGVPAPWLAGEKVRIVPPIVAQADIKETRHKIGKQGLIGAVIGGVAGFLLGKATQKYYYTYSDTFAVMLAFRLDQDPILGVDKLFAGGKTIFNVAEATVVGEALDSDGHLIWRKYKKNKYFKSLTIYGGHKDQPLDPVLADAVGEETGYIFRALAVVEALQLEKFGNSLPEIQALVAVSAGQSLASVAEQICSTAGIDVTRDISTTALTPFAVRGYAVVSDSNCWDALKPLLPAFGVDCADVGGQLRFYRRSQGIRSTITLGDMGAHFYGETPPEPFTFKRGADLDLPKETSLTFVDPDRDYQENTATATRAEGSTESNVKVNIPLVLTADEGASTAALMLWDSTLGRTALNFRLTDQWVGIAVGHAYGIPFAERTIPYRMTRRVRGARGTLDMEGVSDEAVTYSANVAGSSGVLPPEESTLFADTRVMALDMAILDDSHDDYGFYVAKGEGDASWTRGRIEVSNDGSYWVTLEDSQESAVMGDVSGSLAAGATTGLDDTLDTTSVLTVVLLHDLMTLEDASDDELDGGKNLAYVGKDGLGEYLQYKTATKVAAKTWELTNLRRGRKGTDFAIATHATSEEFCLVDDQAGVFRVDMLDPTGWGRPLQFRGVTIHQDEADAAIIDFTNTGEGKRPYSPVDLEDSWDGSNNLTATFTSRSRMLTGGLGVDDRFEFEVEITNATPVRTIVVTAESFGYTAAEQTADGLTPGTVVEGRVRQTSDVNNGRWRDFTFIGPLARTADSTFLTADDTAHTADMA